ncbi:hypothetical protein Y032_0165g28 [Ancylostoma ceylanicum]|uniref:Uncharacterized protein n=1 Tax=Ancylostoma ceylanicum TaxID=53326 RepID=A0A016SX77_9BILA|nr:hypothetical protein Y032_0165g28 [Ancylostoma ceylanicum]
MYLKCPKMVSKPVFRDGVCTSLLEQIYVQRRVSPLISSIGQDKTCLPDVAAVAGSQHQVPAFWSGSAPAPRIGYFVLIKKQSFRHFCNFYCTLLESAWRGGQESANIVDLRNEVVPCL